MIHNGQKKKFHKHNQSDLTNLISQMLLSHNMIEMCNNEEEDGINEQKKIGRWWMKKQEQDPSRNREKKSFKIVGMRK